jgi:hypothetical protein
MERRLANVPRVGTSWTRVARGGWSFAENEKLDESADQEDDGKLTDEEALCEGQLSYHCGIPTLATNNVV